VVSFVGIRGVLALPKVLLGNGEKSTDGVLELGWGEVGWGGVGWGAVGWGEGFGVKESKRQRLW
jgi:hypothetical protein